jgi:predicted amidohydrolase
VGVVGEEQQMKSLRVATCQFSVEPSIRHNRQWVLKQMEQAAEAGADVAHFSETALSGYAGVDIAGTDAIDWNALTAATRDIMAAARKLRLWVVLGSAHRLSDGVRPHNSLYVIDAKGSIVDRYDKRFCTGLGGEYPTLDLCHYSPGDHFTTFRIKGVTCGVLICYDYRFPELFREYRKLGAQVIFHSFHNARRSVVEDEKYNIWKTIVPATMSCRAAENHFWVSANNSTTRPSCWPSFSVRPDGQIMGRLRQHSPGVLLTDMVMDPTLFDAPGPWRERAMSGKLFSGEPVRDPRSEDRRCL